MSITVHASDILDRYFLQIRAKLLELAADLDRIDRAPDAAELQRDPRMVFTREALAVIQSPGSGRAERIQRLYSKE